jgi:hypothetical protein
MKYPLQFEKKITITITRHDGSARGEQSLPVGARAIVVKRTFIIFVVKELFEVICQQYCRLCCEVT